MRQFTAGELSRMQGTQETAMQDTCLLLSRDAGDEDDYGLPVDQFDSGGSFVCGFKPSSDSSASGNEAMGETEVSLVDAELRLPLTAEASLSNVDRIQITHRFGVELTEQPIYEIDGSAERGPSGLVLNLKLATDGRQ